MRFYLTVGWPLAPEASGHHLLWAHANVGTWRRQEIDVSLV
jgi:hypothetical protein